MISKNKRGAEAIIIINKKEGFVIKRRVEKPYRIKELDIIVRKKRNRTEAKIMEKLLNNNLQVPKIIEIKNFEIVMEFINGKTLKELNDENKLNEKIIKQMAEIVSKMHELGIVHGDLTLKNFLLSEKGLYIIDFGLSYFSHHIEDKATDLVVLKDVLTLENKKHLFDKFLTYYKQKNKEEILKRIKEIEERGRYKRKIKKLV